VAKLVRTEPLKALVVGAFVRGLSMRDVESLCEKAGLGKLPTQTPPPMAVATDLLERSLGEVKRRTEVIGRVPGEQTDSSANASPG
jgi:hypothetical protein